MQLVPQEVAYLSCVPLEGAFRFSGLQDVGHAAVATGSGVLKLRSFRRRLPLFLLSSSRRQPLGT